MPLFYLETSALVKRYKAEKGSEVVDLLFDRKSDDGRLVTSFLAVIEVTGMAVRLRKNGTLTDRGLSELLARFTEDPLQVVELFPVNQFIMGQAVRMAEKHGLRAADSIHLATMAELDRTAKAAGVKLLAVAVDRAVREAAEGEGIVVLNPEDTDAPTRLREFTG